MRATERVEVTRRARAALAWSVVLTLALPRLPVASVLAIPLLWLSTVAHELGHGVAALALGGRFDRFVIRPDGSGTAFTAAPAGDVAGALVSAGGLLGPAVVAALWFALARRELGARVGLALFGAALLAAALALADPGFTTGYLAVVGGLAAAAAALPARFAQLALVFLAVQLALSVFIRGDYLFTEVAGSSAGAMPSDVAVIAGHLGGPYWAWGLACGLASVLVLLLGLRWFVRDGGAPRGLAALRRR